jgi:hypothetical protein
MPSLKILFADDHIPDFHVPQDDTQARAVIRKRYPGCPESDLETWVTLHRHCQRVTETLRSADFAVTTANNYKSAIETVRADHFDIAIIDLGWYNDNAVPQAEQPTKGWDICKAIDESDQEYSGRPTLQIISSTRFGEVPCGSDLLTTAASKGRLPFVKDYGSQLNLDALRACVRFLEKTVNDTSPEAVARQMLRELEQMRHEYLDEPLREMRTWTKAALIAVGLSMALILIGAGIALFWSGTVGLFTSVTSAVTTAVARLFYGRLEKVQQTLSKQMAGLREDINSTWAKATQVTS